MWAFTRLGFLFARQLLLFLAASLLVLTVVTGWVFVPAFGVSELELIFVLLALAFLFHWRADAGPIATRQQGDGYSRFLVEAAKNILGENRTHTTTFLITTVHVDSAHIYVNFLDGMQMKFHISSKSYQFKLVTNPRSRLFTKWDLDSAVAAVDKAAKKAKKQC